MFALLIAIMLKRVQLKKNNENPIKCPDGEFPVPRLATERYWVTVPCTTRTNPFCITTKEEKTRIITKYICVKQ